MGYFDSYINDYVNNGTSNDALTSAIDSYVNSGSDASSTNGNLLGSVSTGGSYLPQVLAALGTLGSGLAGNSSKGKYYVDSNWAGNGLARSGIGYIGNQNYTNPYNLYRALSSGLSNTGLYNVNGSNLVNLLGKAGSGLKSAGSNIGSWLGTLGSNNIDGTTYTGDLYSNISDIA